MTPVATLRPVPRASDDGASSADRHGLVGASLAIDGLIRQIELVAAVRSTVLISGETGTGKELVARALHRASPWSRAPWVAVNCAAIPDTLLESELFGHVRGAFTDATVDRKGKFAQAHNGSLFLDEIGTMSLRLQAKLLRVLQEREFEPLGSARSERVTVRVIAATNRDLREMMADGRFLADLYYRLHVVPIVVPPLRQRVSDVPRLATHFAAKHAALMGRRIRGVAPDAIALLQSSAWPGNVRQLENTIERAVVMTIGEVIQPDSILVDPAPPSDAAALPSLKLHENVEWAERETIRRALERSSDKQSAARAMGISARALSYYLAKHGAIDRAGKATPAALLVDG